MKRKCGALDHLKKHHQDDFMWPESKTQNKRNLLRVCGERKSD